MNGESYKLDKAGEKITVWNFKNNVLLERKDLKVSYNDKNEETVKKLYDQIKQLNLRIKANPRNIAYRTYNAELHLRLGNRVLAQRTLFQLLRVFKNKEYLQKLPPKLKGNYFDVLAQMYSYYEMEDHAIHYRFLAVKVNPEQTRLVYNLGSYLVGLKEYDMAKSFLDEVLQVWPKHAFTHRALSRLYLNKKDYTKAKHHIDIAFPREQHLMKLGQHDLDWNIRAIRGLASHKTGNTASGIEDLEKAISMKSTNAVAYRNLGIIYHDLEDYQKACEMFTKADDLGYIKTHDDKGLKQLIENSCNRDIAQKTITETKKPLLVYPNPSDKIITVGNIDKENFGFKIFSFDNRLVKQGKANQFSIDISLLSSGLYLLQIEGETYPLKFIRR